MTTTINYMSDDLTRDQLAVLAGCRDGDDHQYVIDMANLMMDKTRAPGGPVMSVRHPVDGRIGLLVWVGAAYAVWDGQTLRSVDQRWAEALGGKVAERKPVELPATPGFESDLF